MRRFLRRRDEAAALDALLDGSGTPGDPTADLLAAASAPENTAPDGLDAALAAFGRGDRPRRERRTGQVWRRVLATTLTTKIVAGASVAVAAAGITVASTRHHTPAPRRPVPITSDAPSSGPGGPSTGSPSRSRTPSSPSPTDGSPTSTTPGASGTVSGSPTTTGSPSAAPTSSRPVTAGPSPSEGTTGPTPTVTSRVSRPVESPGARPFR